MVEIVMKEFKKSGDIAETTLVTLPDVEFSIIPHILETLSFPNLKIYLKKQEVYQSGKLLLLSNHEFLALRFMAERPKWVCTKWEIYDAVCGGEIGGDIDNIVYCLICSLRKKIEINPRHPEYIRTVRGVGYKFMIPGE